MRLVLPLLALIPLVAVACGGDDGDGPGGSGGAGAGTTTGPSTGGAGGGGSTGLPCDVEAVLQQSCLGCHGSSPQFGAPMPLVTYDDLMAAAPSDASRQVYELVGTRIHDDTKPMPPPPNARLGAADSAAIDAWVAAGAPSSNETCGGGGGGAGGGGGGGGTQFNCPAPGAVQALTPATPYQMPQQVQDEYICYGVDVDLGASKRHITSLAPLIDNSTIVHHMLLFSADASYSPTPAPCSGASMGRLMGVWAPGGGALELPPEAGFAVQGTAHYVLQVHYSNLMNLAGQEDSSGYQLCVTEDLRPNDADIMAFGTTQIDIPANGTQDVTCNLTVPSIIPQITTIAAMPHMHKLGTRISTMKNGATDLGTADPWNFDSQAWTLLNTTIAPGDTISTRCAWNNPTAQDVGFGEQTSDEMCFGFVMYYPKIELGVWNWMAPAAASQCSPTP